MKFSTSLKKSASFPEVYRRGRVKSDKNIVLFTLKNGTEQNRLGISVSKKCGNSVIRHRFIRQIREIYRLHEDVFYRGYDLIVVARKENHDFYAEKNNYRELERSFLHLTKKAGIRQ